MSSIPRRVASVAAVLAVVALAAAPVHARGGGSEPPPPPQPQDGDRVVIAGGDGETLELPTLGLAEERLYRAWYRENALRDFRAAETGYGEAAAVAEAVTGAGAVRVRALAGRSRCLAALGRLDEARAAAEAALALDPASVEALAARDAATASPGPDPELAAHVMALVRRLDAPEEARGPARDDLVRVGAAAVPFLAPALRSRAVGLVDGAAQALAALANDRCAAAAVALAEAVGDPATAFPRVIRNAVWNSNVADVCVARALFDSRDPELVRAALKPLSRGYRDGERDEALALVARGLRHGDGEVRHWAIACVTDFGEEDHAVLAEAWAGLLRDSEAGLLMRALEATAPRPILVRAAVDVLRGHLAHADGRVRSAAQWCLVRRGGLPAAEQVREVLEALRSGDFHRYDSAVGNDLLAYPGPWTPEVAALLASGLGRSGGPLAHRIDLAYRIADDARVAALPRAEFARIWETVARWGEERAGEAGGDGDAAEGPTVGDVLMRLRERFLDPVRDSPSAGPAAAEVLSRLADPRAQRAWMGFCEGYSIFLPAEAGMPGAVSGEPALRWLGYGILLRGGARGLREGGVAPASALPHLATDLLSTFPPVTTGEWSDGGDLGHRALALASLAPDPALAPQLRLLMAAPGADWDRRRRALDVLVACAGREALPDVRACMADDRWSYAHRHLVALLGDGCVEDLVALARRLGNAEAPLRPAPPEHQPPPDGPALRGEALARYLDGIRAVADGAGRPIAAPEFTPALADYVLPALKETGRDLDLLAWCAEERRPAFHHVVARRAVRVLGTANAPAFLLGILDSPDEAARSAAADALAGLRTFSRLKSDFGKWLGGDPDDAFRRSAAMLADGDPIKRQGAALALAALGDPAAVPALLRLLDDPEEDVREAALRALDRLGAARAGERQR